MTEPLERRQAPRIALGGRPRARVRETVEVSLTDLSTTGARITLGDPVRHGTSLLLELPATLGALTLAARVIWTITYGSERTLEGEHHALYQCGLAFVKVTPDQRATLARLVEGLLRGKPLELGRETP